MRRFAIRVLLGAAVVVAGIGAARAEMVRPDAATEAAMGESVEDISGVEPPSPDAPSLPASPGEATVPVPPAAATLRQFDRSANALLRELYLADKDVSLDAFLAELRGQALFGTHPSAPSIEARSSCGGRPCPGATRPTRSPEDQELLATLAGFRTDVRDFVSPLQSVYQDSGLKALLDTMRSDDLIFGQNRSSADAVQDRAATSGEGGSDFRGTASRQTQSGEILALVHLIGDLWQVVRNFGIPLLLVLIMVRGFFWVAKARRA